VQLPGHRSAHGGVVTLEVEHERHTLVRRREQRPERQPRYARRPQLPSVPEQRQRTQGLEVVHLEPAVAGVDVRLDDVRPHLGRRPQPGERVAGAVSHRQQGAVAHATAATGACSRA
jgi:hypothetical protein